MGDTPKKSTGRWKWRFKWLELVTQQVDSLRYGIVEIVVHDSRVIQIDKN